MSDGNMPDVLTSSVQATQEWLRSVQDFAGTDDPKLAYHALRATLHALRDRIPPGIGAHFAAQLPTLLRGVYFEDYNPDRPAPKPARHKEEFLELIRADYASPKDTDIELLATAVFQTINRQVSRDLAAKTRMMLSAELQELWPEPGGLQEG